MAARRFGLLLVASLVWAASLAAQGNASLPVGLPTLSVDEVQDLARVELPGNGVGVVLHVHWPASHPALIDGTLYRALTLEVSESGVITRSAVPHNSNTPADEAPECTDPAFAPVGKAWRADDLPIEFAYNRRTTPRYMSPWLATRSLREAHQAWGGTNTKCGEKDTIEFSFNYVGVTSVHPGYDRVNVTDFGKMGKVLALSYVWFRDRRIIEVDLRLNKNYMWTNRSGVDKRFHVKNVAVHEIGHHLGLDDLYEPHGSLTMFGRIGKGEMRKITLGRGDVKGAEILAP